MSVRLAGYELWEGKIHVIGSRWFATTFCEYSIINLDPLEQIMIYQYTKSTLTTCVQGHGQQKLHLLTYVVFTCSRTTIFYVMEYALG